ncbi:MAG: cobalamin-independent methionine synthase II family protein [Planctomycetota bacterium]|nr:cobalamin-independent methionine synthase II family protein [Planctomycetota bacterium]
MSESELFPTSVVGSMPRSAFVRELISDESGVPEERREAWMDAAVRYVVALQEEAGLDVVTDGEWRRKSYIGVIAELASGFELSRRPDGRPWTVVVDRLEPRCPGFIAREIEFLRGVTDRAVKATLPAPALLGERLWDPEKSSRAYPRREDFVRDCVPILRRELELIRDAGADIAQIDDPYLCLFVDPDVRSRYDDPDGAADFAVDMVNQVVQGVGGLRLAVHLCRRTGARARGEARFQGGYGPIIEQLNRLAVHQLTMEFTAPEAGDMEVVRHLREDLEIGLGCVSVTPGEVDSPETIAARVRRALEHVAPERITLNPDCGFAPSSGAVVGLDEVHQKLKNQVAAARHLRQKN